MVAAAHTTCLDRGSQFVAAILSPRVSSRENVTTRLVGDFWEDRASWVSPLRMTAKIGSLCRWSEGRPLMWWANFNAARYVRIEEFFRLRTVAHQKAKCLHVAWERGQA